MKYAIFIMIFLSFQTVALEEDAFDEDLDFEDGQPLEYFIGESWYATSFTYEDSNFDTVVVFVNYSGNVYGSAVFVGGDLSSANYSGASGESFNEWYNSNYFSVNWFIVDTVNP